MNEKLVQQIRQCSTLPSMPAIALQVLELAQKDDSDIAEIAKVITKDPALSSKILRTVNSSFYARNQKVATISHALVILGLQSVKTLVLGFTLVSSLSKQKSIGFKHLDYWRRSIYAATAARTIAGRVAQVQGEECFLAALLMDIGMMVLDQVLGEEYGRVLAKAASHGDLTAVEDAELGMNHAQVAQLLAEMWKLPPVLAVPMAHHHDSNGVEDAMLRELARVVELAGRCADVYVDEEAAGAIKAVRESCAAHQGMSEADCDKLLEEIGERTREVAPLFEISVGNVNFDAILKKANDTLIELTLNTQRQAAQLQEHANTLQVQAANLQEQAAELQVQNQQLKVQATTDGLTGLANRATFDAFLREALSVCSRAGRPLALLLFDLDRFKSINDAHGHPAGDAVLRAVGKTLLTIIRKGHMAARYGGEEMVLVLPGVNRAQAATFAEHARRAVEALAVSHDNRNIPVRTSIGVAVYEPGGPFHQAEHLVKAADLAVYAAKQGGRNCVKVFGIKPAARVAARKSA